MSGYALAHPHYYAVPPLAHCMPSSNYAPCIPNKTLTQKRRIIFINSQTFLLRSAFVSHKVYTSISLAVYVQWKMRVYCMLKELNHLAISFLYKLHNE